MRYTTYYLNDRMIDKKDLPKGAKLSHTKKIETRRGASISRVFERYYEVPLTEKEKREKAEAQRKFFDNLIRESYGDSDEWHGTDNHGWKS